MSWLFWIVLTVGAAIFTPLETVESNETRWEEVAEGKEEPLP